MRTDNDSSEAEHTEIMPARQGKGFDRSSYAARRARRMANGHGDGQSQNEDRGGLSRQSNVGPVAGQGGCGS